jgi:hypothetical protein
MKEYEVNKKTKEKKWKSRWVWNYKLNYKTIKDRMLNNIGNYSSQIRMVKCFLNISINNNNVIIDIPVCGVFRKVEVDGNSVTIPCIVLRHNVI